MEVDAFVNKCRPTEEGGGAPTDHIHHQTTHNLHATIICILAAWAPSSSISSVRSLTISLRCPSLVGSAEPNTRIEVRGRVYSRGLAASRRRAGLDANGAEATYIIPHNTRRRRPDGVYFSVSSARLSYSPGYGTEPLAGANPAAAGNVVQVVEVLPERETDKELES